MIAVVGWFLAAARLEARRAGHWQFHQGTSVAAVAVTVPFHASRGEKYDMLGLGAGCRGSCQGFVEWFSSSWTVI